MKSVRRRCDVSIDGAATFPRKRQVGDRANADRHDRGQLSRPTISIEIDLIVILVGGICFGWDCQRSCAPRFAPLGVAPLLARGAKPPTRITIKSIVIESIDLDRDNSCASARRSQLTRRGWADAFAHGSPRKRRSTDRTRFVETSPRHRCAARSNSERFSIGQPRHASLMISTLSPVTATTSNRHWSYAGFSRTR